jgi:hypothetical protein
MQALQLGAQLVDALSPETEEELFGHDEDDPPEQLKISRVAVVHVPPGIISAIGPRPAKDLISSC